MRVTTPPLIVALAILFFNVTLAPCQVSARDFEIDKSKPYVYIKFDHFGERKPVNDWESTNGLWLRLVNNCRLPIQVSVLGLGTGDPGVALNFDVVPTPGRDAPDSEQRKKMPNGYAADVGTLVTIQPKRDLLFSMPAESVTKQWFIQVRFSFALPEPKSVATPTSGNYEPYSVVDFTWYNIPEERKKALSDLGEPKAALNAATMPHESDHVDPPKLQ